MKTNFQTYFARGLSIAMLGITLTFPSVDLAKDSEATGTQAANQQPIDLTKIKADDPLPANLFVELAKKMNPIVVNISTTTRPQRAFPGPQGRGGGRDPFWDFFEEFMGPQGSRPEAQPAQSIGTGFVIDADGLILTNNHVVEQADEIKVQFANEPNKTHQATIVGRDARSDVAIIKIKTDRKLQVATLGSSDQVEVGEWVAAFGNPYGHAFSMSKGIVSAKGRRIRDLNSVPFIQTDASINPGNSGGPLVDIHGRVIGINSAIDARAQGIGFAIPIDHVKSILPQLKEKGGVAYGYLGVELGQINPRAVQVLGLPNSDGAIIMGVVPGGPADKAGVQPYDVVTELGKSKIRDPNELIDGVKDTAIGSKQTLSIFREGKKLNLSVVIGEAPRNGQAQIRRSNPANQGRSVPHNIGFKVVDYSDKLMRELQVEPTGQKGPIVVEVSQGSAAAMNGLRAGDIILDVNRQKVSNANEVIKNLKKGSNVLRVHSGGRTSLVFIEVE